MKYKDILKRKTNEKRRFHRILAMLICYCGYIKIRYNLHSFKDLITKLSGASLLDWFHGILGFVAGISVFLFSSYTYKNGKFVKRLPKIEEL